MDKETTTSVTIDRKTFARLDRLAKSNNVSKKEFLSCALEYFEKYGINPVEHESPAKEMQKLIKRCDQVIAFIRKQEQDFLRPACEAMGSTSMRVTMSMDSILTEKKFSQYQKDNDLFMRDLASLAGIREQALDRAEKAVGQSRDMLLKNQQAIYARLDAVTQRQEKIFSYIASYIDAKGKAGLFDDIKALYKNEKNKRDMEVRYEATSVRLTIMRRANEDNVKLLYLKPPSLRHLLTAISISAIRSGPISLKTLAAAISSLVSVTISVTPSDILNPSAVKLTINSESEINPKGPKTKSSGRDNI